MRLMRFLILGLLIMVATAHAQGPFEGPGWFTATSPGGSLSNWNSSYTSGIPSPLGLPPQTAFAEQPASPEIVALAYGLGNDPTRIFNFVHDHIQHNLYFGSLKGAVQTLEERSGNDFDQCALLISLLEAAGYTSVSYQFGEVVMPYDRSDHNDIHHWLGLAFNNTNWTYTQNYMQNLLILRGYPTNAIFNNGATDTNDLVFQRVWVSLVIGGTNYYLDPAMKACTNIAPIISLPTAMGLNTNTLYSTAGGTVTTNSIEGLNEGNVRATLLTYTTNLLAYLQNNCPNATVQQIIGGSQIIPSGSSPLSTTNLFPVITNVQAYPVLNWSAIPNNFMTTLTIGLPGLGNQVFYTPDLGVDRLALTFSASGMASLWREDNIVVSNQMSGSAKVNVTVNIDHPYGGWQTAYANDVAPSGLYSQHTSQQYQATNANYILLHSFRATPQVLLKRQQKLDAYRQQGYSDTSTPVVSESLNVMALTWLVETELGDELIDQQMGLLPLFHHRAGRMGQEAGAGFYIDVYAQGDGVLPYTGNSPADLQNYAQGYQVATYFTSAMEHGLIEQCQSSNIVGASTVKILEVASTNSQTIYLMSSTNWSAVAPLLSNYDTNYLYTNYIVNNYYILLPQSGSVNPSGISGNWSGAGYVALQSFAGSTRMDMIISGLYGGYDSDPDYTPPPATIQSSGDEQSTTLNIQPPLVFGAGLTGLDPVNTADGTFQVESTDLSLGQTEPRGLTLSRHYSSALRNNNFAGMAPGWLHNYYFNAAPVSAPQLSLGTSTPQQMAPMLVATCAALNLYNAQPNAKDWMMAALISKWGIDQLVQKSVSVSLGQSTIQFIQQPDGSFTPPANSTLTLIQTNGVYWLSERHGRTFKFASSGVLTNIVDQYVRLMAFTYNASNWVSTVTDWTNRSLTFTYSGTPSRLTSISDNSSPSRSVTYGYTNNANGQLDLVSVIDAQGFTNAYQYDTNHQIIVVRDNLSQVVSSNVFDGFGRVVQQFSQGSTNQMWQGFWSGYQNTLIDPAGGQQQYFYDDQVRQTGAQDALGNLSQLFYDGQNHVVMTVSPLLETNQFFYDGNQNLTNSIDPLGFTNSFFYDASFNLISMIDARGRTNSFGYNTKFQVTGATNAAGNAVTNTYDSGTGLLLTRADAGGTTTYGYDSYGQLNSVIYPGGLGTNLFLNNALGDVLTNTNPRGIATGYQYNHRRQLTQRTGPTNLTSTTIYDAVGNVATNTDARTNNTVFTWSPTRHLLTTTLPGPGAPQIINTYDNRDWLIKTLDPLSQPTTNGYDFAGRLLSVTDPLLRPTQMTYDNDGRKLTMANAALQGISLQYDQRGQLTQTTDQLLQKINSVFDPSGNRIFLTNRLGKVWQFQFDAANRLTNIISPLTNQIAQIWNNRGLLQNIIDARTQTNTFLYDALGRLTNRTDNIAATTYQYDFDGNRIAVLESGKSNTWTFDAYDRTFSCTDSGGNQIQYRYDNNGNLTSLIYPGNRTVTYAYDNLNRLTTVTDWASRQTTYTYDLDSRVTSITRPNGTVRSNFYDIAGELTNIVEQAASHAPIAFFKLSYNSAARVQWEFMAPTNQTFTPPSRTSTYDADNRLATLNTTIIVNDNNGNMTSGPLTNSTLTTYAFDARNRLTSAGGVTYGYDPANNRVGVTNSATTNTFVIDPQSSQVLIRFKNGVTNYYVYGLGLIYEEDDTPSTTITLTYHFDSRGSTVALTDGNGNVTDRIQYSAYGLVTYRAGTNDTPFQFNGRYGVQTDPNGLLYMRARFYNPYLCRFINADPSGFSGGLNFYAFADGNPISETDPFGLNTANPSPGYTWVGSISNVGAPGSPDLQGSGVASDLGAMGLNLITAAGNTALREISAVISTVSDGVGGDLNALGPIGFEMQEVGIATRELGVAGEVAEGEGTFAYYMRQAQTLDVSTAENGAVFYSGPGNRALAEQFAIGNGGTTLEMTPGGAWLDQQQLFNTAQSGLTTEQAAQVWSTLSQRFAQGASGNAFGFVNGARAGGIFNTVEYPALLNNPSVVNVITGGH